MKKHVNLILENCVKLTSNYSSAILHKIFTKTNSKRTHVKITLKLTKKYSCIIRGYYLASSIFRYSVTKTVSSIWVENVYIICWDVLKIILLKILFIILKAYGIQFCENLKYTILRNLEIVWSYTFLLTFI